MTFSRMNDMFFYTNFNIIDFTEKILFPVGSGTIKPSVKLNTLILPFIITLDEKLGRLGISSIKNFLKLYCSLGVLSRWSDLIPLDDSELEEKCSSIVHKILPLTYCEVLKESIGVSVVNGIEKIEEIVSHVTEEFKRMLLLLQPLPQPLPSTSDTAAGVPELTHLGTLTATSDEITMAVKALNNVYINIGKCHSEQWEHNIKKKLSLSSSLESKTLLEIENAMEISDQCNFTATIISLLENSKRSDNSAALFKIHRKNFIRNDYFSKTPTETSTTTTLSRVQRLYNMIDETSPRYNEESNEVIFPIQMLLSPLVRSSYPFETQLGLFSFFIAHELTHVVQRAIRTDNTIPTTMMMTTTQIELENQADKVAMEVSLSLLERFTRATNGKETFKRETFKKETFEKMLQFWCLNSKQDKSPPANQRGHKYIDTDHLIGERRINNIIQTMSHSYKMKFNKAYHC